MREAGYLPAHFHIYTGNFVAGETTLQTGEHFLAGERANLSVYYSANLIIAVRIHFQHYISSVVLLNDLGDVASSATTLS